MSTVAVRPENEIIQRDKLMEYLATFVCGQLSQLESSQFIEIAQAFNLNPFKKEIYCIPYGEGDKRKLSILTGYEVYLKRAERTGQLDGWRAWTEGTITEKTIVKKIKKRDGGVWEKEVIAWVGNLKAMIEIYRKDRTRPFVHEVLFSEYTQDNDVWGSKPQTMIKKVAMAQGFRLCFPDELAGMPYTPEELPDEMTRNVTPEPQIKPEEPKQSVIPVVTAKADVSDAVVVPEPVKTQPIKPAPVPEKAYEPSSESIDHAQKLQASPELQKYDYAAYRTSTIQVLGRIVGTNGGEGSWTQGEKDFIGVTRMIKESAANHDKKMLDVAMLRVKIGALVRATADWGKVMPQVMDMGMDIDSLQVLLTALENRNQEPKAEKKELDIF